MMSSSWTIWVGPKSEDKVSLLGKEKTQKGRTREDAGRDGSSAATSQGAPKATGSWKRQGRMPPGAFGGSMVLRHLDFDFWPPEFQENKFPLF